VHTPPCAAPPVAEVLVVTLDVDDAAEAPPAPGAPSMTVTSPPHAAVRRMAVVMAMVV